MSRMAEWEVEVFDELKRAVAAGEPCPTNLDLEMIIGCSSGSNVPKLIGRLERKGLIRVIRWQR